MLWTGRRWLASRVVRLLRWQPIGVQQGIVHSDEAHEHITVLAYCSVKIQEVACMVSDTGCITSLLSVFVSWVMRIE